MAPTSSLLLFLISSVLVMLPAATADGQGGKHCAPVVCGNLTISYPFGLVSEEATETNDCGVLGFQVHCYGNSTAFLRGLQILNIFYDKASLLVADFYKLHVDFNRSARNGCQARTVNSSTKISSPVLISPVNQNLIFYNCTKPLAEEVRKNCSLVETACRNNTYVRAEGSYDHEDVSSSYGNYSLEGCNATIAPVLVESGKANARNYMQLISGGFLLTWQMPPLSSGMFHN
ncbi:unnamed protein product [Urochloa humidicola]